MRDTPYFVDLRPGGKYVAKDLHEVGGVPVVMKELRSAGLLHEDCMTARGPDPRRGARRRSAARPTAGSSTRSPRRSPKTGGVVGPQGQPRPRRRHREGRRHERGEQVFTGPARVFDCEEDAFEAVRPRLQGRRGPRHPQRGPRRRPGHARDAGHHRRALRPGHGQEGRAHHRRPLLRRHARLLRRAMSGPRRRMAAPSRCCGTATSSRSTPSRASSRSRSSDEELAARREAWKGPRETQYASGALWKYARLVGPARLGAVTHPGAKAERHVYADLEAPRLAASPPSGSSSPAAIRRRWRRARRRGRG